MESTQLTLSASQTVQGAVETNMLFITRSLLAGRGRPIQFQRQGQRKRAKDALAAGLATQLQTRCEISRIISPTQVPPDPGDFQAMRDVASMRA
jgi:hypothetical protein